MSAIDAYPRLSQVFELVRAGSRQGPEFVRTEQAAWHQELEAAVADAAARILAHMEDQA